MKKINPQFPHVDNLCYLCGGNLQSGKIWLLATTVKNAKTAIVQFVNLLLWLSKYSRL